MPSGTGHRADRRLSASLNNSWPGNLAHSRFHPRARLWEHLSWVNSNHPLSSIDVEFICLATSSSPPSENKLATSPRTSHTTSSLQPPPLDFLPLLLSKLPHPSIQVW